MSDSIQKYSLLQNIRFYYLRYRGNISKMIEGLKNLPEYRDTTIDPVYVQKVIKKFKKERNTDLNLHVCYNFMEHLHMGVNERLCRYHEWLDKLDDSSSMLVSVCHQFPVGIITELEGEETIYRCLHEDCGNRCAAVPIESSEIYKLRMQILNEMRKDEVVLLKAIKDLGFSVEKPPEINKITQYNIQVADDRRNRKIIPESSSEDTKLLQGIDQMDPRSRERMIKDLEKKIVDTKFETDEESSK